jgi:glycine/D-amino acid oxidase-like deaminating enzyme
VLRRVDKWCQIHGDCCCSFRLDASGRLVFGGRGTLSSENPAPASLRTVIAAMHQTFPAVREVPIAHRWAGLVDLRADRRLHIHRLVDGQTPVVGLSDRDGGVQGAGGGDPPAFVCRATAPGRAVAPARTA